MTGNHSSPGKTAQPERPRVTAVLDMIRNVGELLRQAAVIAFTMRCKIIDDR